MEDQDAHLGSVAYLSKPGNCQLWEPQDRLDKLQGHGNLRQTVPTGQRYRLRSKRSRKEAVVDNLREDRVYVDSETGEEMEVVGKQLPLAPSASKLPRAVENLRVCPHCEQLVGRDLSECPYCDRRIPA